MLVLGLGNTLLADDGVGVHVVQRLSADAGTPRWLVPVDGGTMGFRLAGLLCGAGDVLIIDAADMAAAPGTIRLLEADALGDYVAQGKRSSAHEAGLADLLGLMRLENFRPRHLAVLAIQPEVIDWRDTLSASVQKALGPACALVNSTALEWRATS